jgi:hypothetical protein
MSTPPKDKSVKSPGKPDRAAREAAALRANLLKRKDQARQREEAKEKSVPDRSAGGKGRAGP